MWMNARSETVLILLVAAGDNLHPIVSYWDKNCLPKAFHKFETVYGIVPTCVLLVKTFIRYSKGYLASYKRLNKDHGPTGIIRFNLSYKEPKSVFG